MPRIPSTRLIDLVEAIAPGAETVEVGIRPGEKLHEEMIAADDSRRTIRTGDRYVITPYLAGWGYEPPVGEQMPDGFAYRSDTNDLLLTVEELKTVLDELD